MPNNYKYITGAATTLLAGNDITRILIKAILINKTTAGAVTIKSNGGSGTTIGSFAASTAPGTYWVTISGIEVENPAIINASSEDITVIYTNC